MIPVNFHHIGIMAKNPLELEKFYTKYFGFKRVRVYAPGPDQVVVIKAGALAFEIFKAEKDAPEVPTEAGPTYPSWRHVCFRVENLDAKLEELAQEARITLGPLQMDNFIPGMKVAWLADPEGNIFELNQGYVDEENPPPLEL